MIEVPNTGVIETSPKPADYLAGDIQEVVRVLSGDWTPYESPGKWQKLMGVTAPNNGFNTNGVDFLNCVACSYNDHIATFVNWLHASGNLPETHFNWLKDNNYLTGSGLLNFSNRYTAKMSGTTKDGNSLPAVAEAMRLHKDGTGFGLIPDSMWPTPVDEITANPGKYWETYYEDPPQECIEMGAKFLTWFKLEYEWVFYPGSPATTLTLENSLTIAPLQIATAVCGGWNTDSPIHGCGSGSSHATLLLKYTNKGGTIEDHYVPFNKNLASDYSITYAMRHIVTPLVPGDVIPVANEALKVIQQLPKEQQLNALQRLADALKGFLKALIPS